MGERGLMEEYNRAFNLFVINDEARIAWTVTPICVDEIFNDGVSADPNPISPSDEIWFSPSAPSLEPTLKNKEPLNIQSKPDDSHLFRLQTPGPQSPPAPLPPIPEIRSFMPESGAPMLGPIPTFKRGTVRIYARSFRLTQSPFTEQEVKPSVITVERAALCQIFLETKYHRTFHEPSERAQRRQTLESLVSKGKEMTVQQREKFNQVMTSVESEWSRLSRVRPSIQAFRVEKKLGSGGFGVVNMVTEKATGQVYAMKVHILEGFQLIGVYFQGEDFEMRA